MSWIPMQAVRSMAILAGLGAAGSLWAQTVDPPGLQIEVVARFSAFITSLAFVGPDDILVLQKSDGKVRRIQGGVLLADPVLDLNVNAAGERGLLGIATDPDFVNNGQVYLYYTEAQDADGGAPLGNRVVRYIWDGAALGKPLLVLDLPIDQQLSHNGGKIVFGNDDALYTVIGDQDRFGKLQNVVDGPAPDDTGVILRTNGLGQPLRDNPYFDPTEPGHPLGRYFAYGIRNSFGLAIDPVTGDLWDTENGPADMDEVNRVIAGLDSGWRTIMGPADRSAGDPADLWYAPGAVYSDPEFSWAVTVAPTGLQFVASRRLGCELEHQLLVGGYNCGRIQRFSLDPERSTLEFTTPELEDRVADNANDPCEEEQTELRFAEGLGQVIDIANGPDGFVYVVGLSLPAVYRIRPVEPVVGDTDGDLVPDGCDCGPADAGAWAVTLEVPRLRPSVVDGVLRLGWDDQAAVAGTGTTYEVVSGTLSGLVGSGGFEAACTLARDSNVSATADARPGPPPDDGFYYLARAANGCGAGTYGEGDGPVDPRDTLDAASPEACE